MLLRDRLYGKMRVNPYTDCWEWQGYKRNGKGRNIVQSGEANRMAKLTQKEVKEARQKRARYKTPYAMLADKYGVCKKTMMNAIKGKNWKCVKYFPKAPKEEKE